MNMVRLMRRVLLGRDVDPDYLARIGRLTLDDLEAYDEWTWRAGLPLDMDSLSAWEASRLPTIDAAA